MKASILTDSGERSQGRKVAWDLVTEKVPSSYLEIRRNDLVTSSAPPLRQWDVKGPEIPVWLRAGHVSHTNIIKPVSLP